MGELTWLDESNDRLVDILRPAVVFELPKGVLGFAIPTPAVDSALYPELKEWRDEAISQALREHGVTRRPPI